jgi:hypothetical protein
VDKTPQAKPQNLTGKTTSMALKNKDHQPCPN